MPDELDDMIERTQQYLDFVDGESLPPLLPPEMIARDLQTLARRLKKLEKALEIHANNILNHMP